jgi:DHA1 family tetracycline resistance protein-like MFS transporter
MWETLRGLRGNTRACVLTEPLWGIPYNLYGPYASIYMMALGMNDAQIGLIASVSLFFQIAASFVSGAITDKLGRRRTTFFFDLLSWSVPALIWAVAQNFYYFFVAALFNSLLRITQTSWSCLLTEDAPKDKLVNIWSWVIIAGILSGFFAPLAGILVSRTSLVTAVRILYANAFLLMTVKFVVLYRFSGETVQGKIRMAETAGSSLPSLFTRYRGTLGKITTNPYTMISFFLSLVALIYDTVKGIFWSIMVVKDLGLPDSSIAFFPFIRSAIMLGFYFLVTPFLDHREYRAPLAGGFALLAVSNVFLIASPHGSYLFVGLNTILDAAGYALIGPFRETLVFDAVDPHDRAGILGIFNVALLAIATPFGWISGVLSQSSRALPFVFITLLAAAGVILVFLAARQRRRFGG